MSDRRRSRGNPKKIRAARRVRHPLPARKRTPRRLENRSKYPEE